MNTVVKNMLGVEVTRPNQKLIIMRGISGSGKSTRARELAVNGIVHSTDDLWEATGDYMGAFKKMNESGDWSAHSKMHHRNFLNAKKSMEDGLDPIVIDNTNLRPNEAKNYVKAALELGFADENIIIEDVGTGGVTAEVLAGRNTHGVPLEAIQKMIQRWKGNGTLTIEKIMNSKDKNNRMLYSGVVLDEKSKNKLLTAIGHRIPEGWTIFCHHMTITFKKGLPKELKDDLGKTVPLIVTAIGASDMAVAVKVEGYPSDNEVPHITMAINTEGGGMPSMSKDIEFWVPLESYINVSGIITEVKK